MDKTKNRQEKKTQIKRIILYSYTTSIIVFIRFYNNNKNIVTSKVIHELYNQLSFVFMCIID